jgi:predicted nucleic acid-binding protein
MRTSAGCATMIDIPRGSSVYVDSNIFIYFIEKVPGFFDAANAMFRALAESEARIVTSELSVAECLYMPSRDSHSGLVAVYDQFFAPTGNVNLVPLNGYIARQASLTGGVLGLKLLDAMHYVTALEAGCSALLSADRKFRSSRGLEVFHL